MDSRVSETQRSEGAGEGIDLPERHQLVANWRECIPVFLNEAVVREGSGNGGEKKPDRTKVLTIAPAPGLRVWRGKQCRGDAEDGGQFVHGGSRILARIAAPKIKGELRRG
jgi:hypothetical protein